MRIVILGAPHSAHTIKWVNGLLSLGHNIMLIGFIDDKCLAYDNSKNLETHFISTDAGNTNSLRSKLKWISSISTFRKAIIRFKPDIIHAHYATSYGLLGVLSGVKPLVISAWGSDIYEFPKRSVIHKLILKYILSKASIVLATGNELASEVKKYTRRLVKIVPFGVNIDLFSPAESNKTANPKAITRFIIGTVKKLEPVYGISTLLRAFRGISEKHPELELRLEIIGSGGSENELKNEAIELGIDQKTIFKGYVDNHLLPKHYSNLDLVVIPSLRESFGLSVLEAMSMQVPVIASDVSGFREVGTEDTITYFQPGNVNDLVKALENYLNFTEEFTAKAKLARARVKELYSEQKALSLQMAVYENLISDFSDQ